MSAINFGRNFHKDCSYSNITENEKNRSIHVNKLSNESLHFSVFFLFFSFEEEPLPSSFFSRTGKQLILYWNFSLDIKTYFC